MITDKINKLTLPATILLASLILGGFYYATQVNKQQSIERQQEIKLQEDRRIEEAKAEQEHKEYVAKRRTECYEIYEKERDKWNNVESNYYNEESDFCEITYKNNKYNEAICEVKSAGIEKERKEYEEKHKDKDILDIPVKLLSQPTECRKYFTKEF